MFSFLGVLRQLNDSRTQLEELWAARKLKLDLCLQLRLFERDAVEVRKLSRVTRKPGFGFSDQVGHKPCCTATEDGLACFTSALWQPYTCL